jgi:hypothetical protein
VATGLSIWLFANQSDYTGVVPKHAPQVGDLTFEVGFVLAALLYALFFRIQGGSRSEETLHVAGEAEPVTAG